MELGFISVGEVLVSVFWVGFVFWTDTGSRDKFSHIQTQKREMLAEKLYIIGKSPLYLHVLLNLLMFAKSH